MSECGLDWIGLLWSVFEKWWLKGVGVDLAVL